MEVRRIKNDELQHTGIIGMKWGVRRYQNEDGTLTAAGRARYGYGAPRAASVGTTGVVRKAGDSKHRQFRTTDSNYSLVSLSNRTPNIYKTKTYNDSVDKEMSDVFGKLEKTMTDESFLLNYSFKKGAEKMSNYDRNKLSKILDSSGLKDEVMDSTRVKEVEMIGYNYTHSPNTYGKSSKDHAIYEGRQQQETYRQHKEDPRLRRS